VVTLATKRALPDGGPTFKNLKNSNLDLIVAARTVKRSAVGAVECSEPRLPMREGAIIGRILTEINKKSAYYERNCRRWYHIHQARVARFAEADTNQEISCEDIGQNHTIWSNPLCRFCP
jgi:hypothetical protein